MSIEDILYKKKYPTTKNKYVGIEIEFLMLAKNRNLLAKDLIANNLQWNVHLGDDGSVRDEEFVPQIENRRVTYWNGESYDRQEVVNYNECREGCEIRILGPQKDILTTLKKVCALLEKHGATVNKTCGLHVHLDMRSRNVEKVTSTLFKYQDLLYAMQPKARRTNKFCRKLKSLGVKSRETRHGINRLAYKEHKTLEIRMHEGSIDYVTIKNWVKFLVEIIKQEPEQEVVIPASMKGYVDERINTYK